MSTTNFNFINNLGSTNVLTVYFTPTGGQSQTLGTVQQAEKSPHNPYGTGNAMFPVPDGGGVFTFSSSGAAVKNITLTADYVKTNIVVYQFLNNNLYAVAYEPKADVSSVTTSTSVYWDNLQRNPYMNGCPILAPNVAQCCSNPFSGTPPIKLSSVVQVQPGQNRAPLLSGQPIQLVESLNSFSRMMNYVYSGDTDEGTSLTHYWGDAGLANVFYSNEDVVMLAPAQLVIYSYVNYPPGVFKVTPVGTPIKPGDVIAIFAYFKNEDDSNVYDPVSKLYVSVLSSSPGSSPGTIPGTWLGWWGTTPEDFNTGIALTGGSHGYWDEFFAIYNAAGLGVGNPNSLYYGDFIALVTLTEIGVSRNTNPYPNQNSIEWIGQVGSTSMSPIITNADIASYCTSVSTWFPRFWTVPETQLPQLSSTGTIYMNLGKGTGQTNVANFGKISQSNVLNGNQFGYWQVLDQNCLIPITTPEYCCQNGMCLEASTGQCTGGSCSTPGSQCGQYWSKCISNGTSTTCIPASAADPSATTVSNCCSMLNYSCVNGVCTQVAQGKGQFVDSNCGGLCGQNFEWDGGACTVSSTGSYVNDPTCGGQGQATIYQCAEGNCTPFNSYGQLDSTQPYYWTSNCDGVDCTSQQTWYLCQNGSCNTVPAGTAGATTNSNCCPSSGGGNSSTAWYDKTFLDLKAWEWIVVALVTLLLIVGAITFVQFRNSDSDEDDNE